MTEQVVTAFHYVAGKFVLYLEGYYQMTDNLDMIQNNLKGAVVTLLVTKHDLSIDDAEEATNKSFENNSSLWHEKAEAEKLAQYLANEEDDE